MAACRALLLVNIVDGGGSFFLACEEFGRMFDHSFLACAFFLLLILLLLLFLFKWRLLRTHKFRSLCQDQCTVAQRAETTVAESFLTSCV